MPLRPDHRPAETLRFRDLGAPVTVLRDAFGVPHVVAGSRADLVWANGYVHAADRLWQMDAARRRAVGRYAEWAGPQAVEADALCRRLGIAAVSRADHDALDDATQAMLARYSAGVNAAIRSRPLPREYALLGTEPEPWEPWHCVAVMRQRGLLMGSVWFKLWRAAALPVTGPEGVGLLRYDDGGPERFIVPQGETGARLRAALADLAPGIAALAALAPGDGTLAGSNNWAVSGARTATGAPLLAGDPHRAFEIPAMYVQNHLRCPDLHAMGLAVPGVPLFPHFGHNAQVAWCVTHSFADIHDLYVERFDAADPRLCHTPEGLAPVEERHETVAVRGAAPVTVRIVRTRHGPLIVGRPEDGAAIALRSMQTEPGDRSLACLLPMAEAEGVPALIEATRGWGVIDHNLVVADRAGRIGVTVRAMVPRRPAANGWLPVPGWTAEHDWQGLVPFEDMPRSVDPPGGLIVTANNRPVPAEWPDYLCTDCHPSTRADRIAARLADRRGLDAGDMLDILGDTLSLRAREIAARICAVPVEAPAARGLQALLGGWDGRMDAALTAPTAYMMVRQAMTRGLARRSGLGALAGDACLAVPPGIPPLNQLWWTLPNLLRADDTTLLGGDDWDGVIAEALAEVAAGPPPAPWGEAHRPRFVHPLDGLEGADAPPSAPVPGDGDCVCAMGAYPSGGLAASYGPVARYVFDLADWDNSRWVVFHGASGEPGSAHYGDQNPLWARCALIPAPFSEAAVAAHARSRTDLLPEGAG